MRLEDIRRDVAAFRARVILAAKRPKMRRVAALAHFASVMQIPSLRYRATQKLVNDAMNRAVLPVDADGAIPLRERARVADAAISPELKAHPPRS
jgi:transcriptional regulator of aromatic amino acid metabolism